jgi:protein TonB
MTGIFFVILFHAILVYALINGLAVKVVELIQKPLETRIIEEVKVTPPPEKVVVQPPKFDTPPPPFIPPPEVQVQAPPAQNVIAAATNTPPVEPPAMHAPPAAPPSPAPAVARVELVCSNAAAVQSDAGRRYFRELDRDSSLNGEVQVELTVAASGSVKDVAIRKSSNPTLTRIALAATQLLKCSAQEHDIRAMTAFVFKQQ